MWKLSAGDRPYNIQLSQKDLLDCVYVYFEVKHIHIQCIQHKSRTGSSASVPTVEPERRIFADMRIIEEFPV